MQLKPFLLDAWLDQYEHDIEFNLAASTGPTWTVNDILALADDETRHRFLNHNLVYSRPAGADSLRSLSGRISFVPELVTHIENAEQRVLKAGPHLSVLGFARPIGVSVATVRARRQLHRYIRRALVLDQLAGSSKLLTIELGEQLVTSRALPPLVPL